MIYTYFLPKLTNKELKLVESKDRSYFQTFHYSNATDVDEEEMMLSESDSKYVQSGCARRTFTIKNSSESSFDKQPQQRPRYSTTTFTYTIQQPFSTIDTKRFIELTFHFN